MTSKEIKRQAAELTDRVWGELVQAAKLIESGDKDAGAVALKETCKTVYRDTGAVLPPQCCLHCQGCVLGALVLMAGVRRLRRVARE